MTEEQINIAIAESLGYKAVRASYGHWNLTHPAIGIEVKGWFAREDAYRDAPKYTASLDACAEFEAILNDEQQYDYAWYLVQVADPTEQFRIWKSPNDLAIWELSPRDCFTCASAKPIQRCEAYLRTIGKWTDSNQQPT